MKIWNKPYRSGNSADRRFNRRWEEREQVRTAHHEAGHAVVAHALGFTVELVSIEPDPTNKKVVGRVGIPEYAPPWTLRRHIVSLVGLMAEQKFDPKASKFGGRGDNVVIRQWFPAPEGEAENLRSLANLMVVHFWSDILRIANLLLNTGTISEADFRQSISTPEYQERLDNSPHLNGTLRVLENSFGGVAPYDLLLNK
jgi:hypothetical protein